MKLPFPKAVEITARIVGVIKEMESWVQNVASQSGNELFLL